jgi:enoyl-CoA hydratase/carnithine racemase
MHIRIPSSNAKIGQTEATIGIPSGWGGTQRLLRIVGQAKTKELIYTADEAERIGLVNRVISLNTEEDMQPLPSRSPYCRYCKLDDCSHVGFALCVEQLYGHRRGRAGKEQTVDDIVSEG